MATNQAVQARIREVTASINELKLELTVQERVLAELQSLKVSPQKSRARKKSNTVRPGTLVEAIFNAINRAGHPMTVDDIVADVEAQGHSSTGKAGLRPVVVSAMARSTVFRKTGRSIYGLSEWPETQDHEPEVET